MAFGRGPHTSAQVRHWRAPKAASPSSAFSHAYSPRPPEARKLVYERPGSCAVYARCTASSIKPSRSKSQTARTSCVGQLAGASPLQPRAAKPTSSVPKALGRDSGASTYTSALTGASAHYRRRTCFGLLYVALVRLLPARDLVGVVLGPRVPARRKARKEGWHQTRHQTAAAEQVA